MYFSFLGIAYCTGFTTCSFLSVQAFVYSTISYFKYCNIYPDKVYGENLLIGVKIRNQKSDSYVQFLGPGMH